jgi:hypothetical protein
MGHLNPRPASQPRRSERVWFYVIGALLLIGPLTAGALLFHTIFFGTSTR